MPYDHGAYLEDRFLVYPNRMALNVDPRVCRSSPLIFLLGGPTD